MAFGIRKSVRGVLGFALALAATGTVAVTVDLSTGCAIFSGHPILIAIPAVPVDFVKLGHKSSCQGIVSVFAQVVARKNRHYLWEEASRRTGAMRMY